MTCRVLPPGEAWPRGLSAIVGEGLDQGHRFLDAVARNWADPAGPYAAPGAVFLVAFAGEETIGLAGVVVDPFSKEGRTGRLRHVYVSPPWRRRGVAEALVGAALARARGHFDRLRLRTDNPSAARLYERHGFQPRPDEPESTHVLVFER
ncbi:MAG: GNAT family N-acetyltransferase [Alsobacter sp.]